MIDAESRAQIAEDGLVSWAGGAIVTFVLSAIATFAILWPYRFRFSLSAVGILTILDERESAGSPVTARETYRELALRHEVDYERNARRIVPLLWVFRVAIVLLLVEVVFWVVFVERS